eukprot:g81707.t1
MTKKTRKLGNLYLCPYFYLFSKPEGVDTAERTGCEGYGVVWCDWILCLRMPKESMMGKLGAKVGKWMRQKEVPFAGEFATKDFKVKLKPAPDGAVSSLVDFEDCAVMSEEGLEILNAATTPCVLLITSYNKKDAPQSLVALCHDASGLPRVLSNKDLSKKGLTSMFIAPDSEQTQNGTENVGGVKFHPSPKGGRPMTPKGAVPNLDKHSVLLSVTLAKILDVKDDAKVHVTVLMDLPVARPGLTVWPFDVFFENTGKERGQHQETMDRLQTWVESNTHLVDYWYRYAISKDKENVVDLTACLVRSPLLGDTDVIKVLCQRVGAARRMPAVRFYEPWETQSGGKLLACKSMHHTAGAQRPDLPFPYTLAELAVEKILNVLAEKLDPNYAGGFKATLTSFTDLNQQWETQSPLGIIRSYLTPEPWTVKFGSVSCEVTSTEKKFLVLDVLNLEEFLEFCAYNLPESWEAAVLSQLIRKSPALAIGSTLIPEANLLFSNDLPKEEDGPTLPKDLSLLGETESKCNISDRTHQYLQDIVRFEELLDNSNMNLDKVVRLVNSRKQLVSFFNKSSDPHKTAEKMLAHMDQNGVVFDHLPELALLL